MSRFVRRLPVFALALASLLTALGPSGAAFALDRESYSMEILIGGTPLLEYAARGTSYVEAMKGREYSVRLRNRTGERVAIALSVDGLNSIDARTAHDHGVRGAQVDSRAVRDHHARRLADELEHGAAVHLHDRGSVVWLLARADEEPRPRRRRGLPPEERHADPDPGRGTAH